MDEASLEAFLKFDDADLAANRAGVFAGGQKGRLLWSGVWRLIVGPPLAVAGVVIALASDNALVMIGGLLVSAIALYVAWRGFAFLTDSIVAKVAFVTGPLHKKLVRGKNSVSYYAVIGPVSKRISSGAYNSLPDGENCHLYYAPACRSLLSVEPATSTEPMPDHPFGPDSAHAWNRLRWSWVAITVGAVGLLIGTHAATLAQPVHLVSHETTVSNYVETHGKSTTRRMYLAEDPDPFTPQSESSYDPTAPDFYSLIGKPIVVYTDTASHDILAFRIDGVAYTTDWYAHPEHKTIFEAVNGAITVVLSLLAIAAGILGIRLGFRMQGETSPRPLYAPPTVHQPVPAAWAALGVLGIAVLTLLFVVVVTHL